LVYIYPNQEATLDAQYFSDINSLPNTISTTNGIYVGVSAAQAIIANRSSDGSNINLPYVANFSAPGQWRPTPPAYLPYLLPEWGNETTWCMTNHAQFRPSGPPGLMSSVFVNEYNQIKTLGSLYNSTRTLDQTQIAQFWYDGPASDTPPGHWVVIGEVVASAYNLTLVNKARMFALLSIAVADTAIMAWDGKYVFGRWRPVTAIRAADTVGNPLLVADVNWTPLTTTPNWPDYPSDRAAFGGAASQVLTRLFGSNFSFSITSDGLNVTRSFANFAAAAHEQAVSRIYGGSHFNSSIMDGLFYAMEVGNWAVDNCLLQISNSQRLASSLLVVVSLMVLSLAL